MNGIAFLTLAVAFQGGIEFGWTQLPDDRVEYIIQLDDKAIEALKNGEPLTSSIPPEVKNADRIRIQYGGNILDKPVLSKKPQSFRPNPYANTTAGWQNGHGTVADAPPAIHPAVLNDSRIRDGGLSGQVTVTDGNVSSVSNSTMNATRQTTFVTPQGTNPAISHWRDSNRVINNFDNQNRSSFDAQSRTADTRSSSNGNGSSSFGSGNNTGFTGGSNTAQPNSNLGTNPNLNTNARTNSGITNTNPGNANIGNANMGGNKANNLQPNSNFNLNNASNRTGFTTGNTNTGATGQLNNTGGGFSGKMAPVPNRNTNPNNWNSANRNNTSFQNPNTNLNPNNITPIGNPNLGVNPNNVVANPQNNFPNAQNFNTPIQPTGTPGFVHQPTPGIGYPVNASAPSNEMAMMKKRLEEMELESRQKEHDAEIAKLKSDQKAELEKLTAQFKEFQKKKEEKSDAGPVLAQAKEETTSKGSSNGIASVFLVISLGLNVFLVVQYLSVQNQFRDLSNDLRDTFMTNTYE